MGLIGLICFTAFFTGYLLNMVTITVLYHRGLAHGAVTLRPWLRTLIQHGGIWITGLDPKAWVCMHRMHHVHSDTPSDPHSPVHLGIFGVLTGQLRSYKRTLIGLIRRDPEYTQHVRDLDFGVSRLNRNGLWLLPYALQVALGVGLASLSGSALAGVLWVLGMMSHPVQGWAVNAFGHAMGRRSFETDDNSRNNHLVALLTMGEGYQNNHHAHPRSARFSYRRGELDIGYAFVALLGAVGALAIDREHLIPDAAHPAPAELSR
ncbi:MAG: stearoyl-CoA desaturase (delta-9 desaturase) [Myxococcota bacterium]